MQGDRVMRDASSLVAGIDRVIEGELREVASVVLADGDLMIVVAVVSGDDRAGHVVVRVIGAVSGLMERGKHLDAEKPRDAPDHREQTLFGPDPCHLAGQVRERGYPGSTPVTIRNKSRLAGNARRNGQRIDAF